jgi:hypothetical protein
MSYRTLTLIIVLSLAGSLTAFSRVAQQKPAAPAAPAAAPAAQQPPPQEELSPLAVPKDYHYNARARRDPFVNPVPKPPAPAKPDRPEVVVRPPGLKGVMVSEAEIIGIVHSKEPQMNVVTIQAPGGKRYFARVGDALFDAVIRGIKDDSVTFAVTAPGATDSRNAREVVRKLRGENK